MVQKLLWGFLLKTDNFCFLIIAQFLLYHIVSWCVEGVRWVVGGFPEITSLNPITILIVLLLGLWLLLDCDNFRIILAKLEVWTREPSANYSHFARIRENHYL